MLNVENTALLPMPIGPNSPGPTSAQGHPSPAVRPLQQKAAPLRLDTLPTDVLDLIASDAVGPARNMNLKRAASEPHERLRESVGVKHAHVEDKTHQQISMPAQLVTLPEEILDIIAKEAVGPAKGFTALRATYGLVHGNRQLLQKMMRLSTINVPRHQFQQSSHKLQFLWQVAHEKLGPLAPGEYGIWYPFIDYLPAHIRIKLVEHHKSRFSLQEKWHVSCEHSEFADRSPFFRIRLKKKERIQALLCAFDYRHTNDDALRFCCDNVEIMTPEQKRLLYVTFQTQGVEDKFDVIPTSLLRELDKDHSKAYRDLILRLIGDVVSKEVYEPWGERAGNFAEQNLAYVCESLTPAEADRLAQKGNLFLALKVATLGYGPGYKMVWTQEQVEKVVARIYSDNYVSVRDIDQALSKSFAFLTPFFQKNLSKQLTDHWYAFGSLRKLPKDQQYFLPHVLSGLHREHFPFRAEYVSFFASCSTHEWIGQAPFLGKTLASSVCSVDTLRESLKKLSHSDDDNDVDGLFLGIHDIGLMIPDEKAEILLAWISRAQSDGLQNIRAHLLEILGLLSSRIQDRAIEIIVGTPEPVGWLSGDSLDLSSFLSPDAFSRVIKHGINSAWDRRTKLLFLSMIAPTKQRYIDPEALDDVIGVLSAEGLFTSKAGCAVISWYLAADLTMTQRIRLESKILSCKNICLPLGPLGHLDFSPLI